MTAASRCRSTRSSHERTLFRREILQGTDSLARAASSRRRSPAAEAPPAQHCGAHRGPAPLAAGGTFPISSTRPQGPMLPQPQAALAWKRLRKSTARHWARWRAAAARAPHQAQPQGALPRLRNSRKSNNSCLFRLFIMREQMKTQSC